MKTPGQRQLISLQERVKVGEITVDEAVNEFKAWKFDQDGRACSVRYQQVGQYSHVAEGNNKNNNKSDNKQGEWCHSLVPFLLFWFRKTWSDSEKASPGDTKRGRKQGRSLVRSYKCSSQVAVCVWIWSVASWGDERRSQATEESPLSLRENWPVVFAYVTSFLLLPLRE